jgi:glycosyltransferase involved in cell wall biosynthesis
LRILYLTDNNSVHNRRFLEKLVSAGHEVRFWNLTATNSTSSEAELPDTMRRKVRVITSTQTVERGASPGEYRRLLPQLRSILEEIKPSLVHAGPIPSTGYLAALTDFHPLLVMSWGSDLLLDADRNPEWQQATKLALQKADALFCDCNTVREKANRYRAFPDSQVVQFPWGVKPGVFSPKGPLPPSNKSKPLPGMTTFIYTRSYDPLYGTDILLEGFRKAQAVNPSLRLLLLGNGSQSETISSFIHAHGLAGAVLQIGPQPDAELPMWFRAADIYISCAKSDGTSISLLEAMATGLPVVVTDIPSNREWVTEPQNGWLATPGSADAVANKIQQAADLNSEERKEISERNQTVVAKRADWDKNFPSLFAMYDRLVNNLQGSKVS